MIDFPKETVKKAYENAPEKIKDIFSSSLFINRIAAIGVKHNLRLDKTSEIVKLVTFTLLELIDIKDFPEMLEVELELNHHEAIEITKDIDEQVFQDIRRIITGEIEFTDLVVEKLKELNNGKLPPVEEVEKVLKERKVSPWLGEEYFLDNDQIDESDNEENNIPFKERYKEKVVEKKEEVIDPYREPID